MTIQSRVITWFRRNARDLPWRASDVTAWQVLVSEVMLQQTPAARVAPLWTEWISQWPDAHSLAEASTADVLRRWGSLGYPGRALRLQRCARVVADQFNGEVPSHYDELIKLPGIGDYTASAILAFAFGQSSVVLDTNVRRVIARVWHGMQSPPATVTVAEREFARSLLPPAHADVWAAAVMELGATVCRAKNPMCEACVIADSCSWLAHGQPESPRARPAQRFEGTDRQVRGRIMAVLRNVEGSIAHDDVRSRVQAALPALQTAQYDRAMLGLLDDGLVDRTRAGRLRLPR